MKLSKANAKQIGWAAVGVVAGITLYENLRQLAGGTIVGRALEGRLLRS